MQFQSVFFNSFSCRSYDMNCVPQIIFQLASIFIFLSCFQNFSYNLCISPKLPPWAAGLLHQSPYLNRSFSQAFSFFILSLLGFDSWFTGSQYRQFYLFSFLGVSFLLSRIAIWLIIHTPTQAASVIEFAYIAQFSLVFSYFCPELFVVSII